MRTLKIGIVLSVISAATLVAVGGPDNPYHSKEKSDIAALVDKEVAAIKADSDTTDDKKKAKHLAKIGQLLLEEPKGAPLALGVFEEALSYDSSNAEANFFAAILGPIQTLKGFPFKLKKIAGAVEMEKAIEEVLAGIGNKDTQNLVCDLLQ